MSHNFVLTPQAEADALAIWEYIADDDSEKAADRVVARIYDECVRLGNMPVQVIAIVHGARDLDAFFADRTS